jgi:hypothetical protein
LRIQEAVEISESWKAEKNGLSGGLALNDLSGNFGIAVIRCPDGPKTEIEGGDRH